MQTYRPRGLLVGRVAVIMGANQGIERETTIRTALDGATVTPNFYLQTTPPPSVGAR
jgi:hypothetical protein